MHNKDMLGRNNLCISDTNRNIHDSVCSPSNILPFSLTQPFHLLCPKLASCYSAPSGGSLWPAVSPVFSHCWFRLGARMLPLARGMSSRLILIIPPHFNGKPARHAGFTNASCRESLVSCLTSGKSQQTGPRLCFRVCVIQFDRNACLMSLQPRVQLHVIQYPATLPGLISIVGGRGLK